MFPRVDTVIQAELFRSPLRGPGEFGPQVRCIHDIVSAHYVSILRHQTGSPLPKGGF